MAICYSNVKQKAAILFVGDTKKVGAYPFALQQSDRLLAKCHPC